MFAKRLACTVLAALTITLFASRSPAADDERPNVLLIAIDDLNDWVGPLAGHPQVITPHLDRLARRSVVFANAHCAAPLCRPSRAALFSGRHTFQTGVFNNSSTGIRRAHPNMALLPQHFASAGYRTLGTGKLLHNSSKGLCKEEFYPHQRWSPFTRRQVQYTPKELPSKGSDNPRHVIHNGPGGQNYVLPLNRMPSDRNPQKRDGESFDWGPLDVPDSAMGDGQITDWAVERLVEAADKPQPFFLAVGYYRPHIPLFAPKKYFDLYPEETEITLPPSVANDLDDLSPLARRWATRAVTAGDHASVVKHDQWRAAVRGYLACVTFVDAQIGRLLAALEESPFAENTIIIVFSDHGWHLGEKQHWGKWTGWQRSTRVPLLIAHPRLTAGSQPATGAKCAEPVSLLDLYPTLSDLCGLPEQKELAGQSFAPLLADPQKSTGRVVVTTFNRGNYALTSRSQRYLRYADGSEELYESASDPHEWRNVAASRPADVARMRELLPKKVVE